MNLTLQHDTQAHKVFTTIDGKVAEMDYRILSDGKTLDYYHTFVPPELRGQQIAEKIVKYALDYAHTNHFKVVPSCPFVKRIIEHNLKYQDLL